MAGTRKGRKNGAMKGEELLKFESVQKWFESLDESARKRGKKGLTDAAKRIRLSRMMDYTKDGQINPDLLLEEAKKDINKAGKRLDEYFQEKVDSGRSWNTTITDVGFLRGFYSHNDLVLPKRWSTPKRKVSKVSIRDEKTALYDYDNEKGEVIFKNGTLQHFVQNLNFRDQTIALSLLSTGADAADLLKLNVDFVKDGKGKVSLINRFFWHSNREKTGEEFKTFFSEEATEFLKRYVEQERSNAKDDEPLFAKEDDGRLDVHALAMNFRVAAKKMGYTKKGQSSPFRPKRFRHWFRTACGIANVEEGYTKAFMGHANDVSASYLERNKGLFEMEYVKLEPYVTVFGVNKTAVTEMSQKLEAFKERVDELAIEEHETKLQSEKLESTVKRLKDEVEDLKERLITATEIIHTLEPILNEWLEVSDLPEFKELLERARMEFDNKQKAEILKSEKEIKLSRREKERLKNLVTKGK